MFKAEDESLGREYMQGSIFGKPLKVNKDNEDDMKVIVECPNCGQPTEYGFIRMCSGFIGCDNKLEDGRECYFEDLLPRVLKMQEYNHEAYTKGIGIYLKDIKGSEYK